MSIKLLTQAYDEIKHLIIAGAQTARGNEKLCFISQELKSSKLPAFLKASDLLNSCVGNDDVQTIARSLLSAGAFIWAVLSTQAAYDCAGEFCQDFLENEFIDILKKFDVPAVPKNQMTYKELIPTINALKDNNQRAIIASQANGAAQDLRMTFFFLHYFKNVNNDIIAELGRPALKGLLCDIDISSDDLVNQKRLGAILKFFKNYLFIALNNCAEKEKL